MEPTHPDRLVENVTAPSAGGFPGPDREVRLRMRLPFRTGSSESHKRTRTQRSGARSRTRGWEWSKIARSWIPSGSVALDFAGVGLHGVPDDQARESGSRTGERERVRVRERGERGLQRSMAKQARVGGATGLGIERTRDGIRTREIGVATVLLRRWPNSAARFERCSEAWRQTRQECRPRRRYPC
ncbi:MAG: hypothetical protein ACOX52_19590 [Verrucomicrobiota bacterium]